MKTKRMLSGIVSCLLALAALRAEEARQPNPEAKARREAVREARRKKLDMPFMKKVDWFTDFDKAKEEAARTGKPIFAFLAYETCPGCAKMENGVLTEDAFARFAQDYVPFYHLFTQTKIAETPANRKIETMVGNRFPYFFFLDAQGNLLGRHQGQHTAEGFRQTAEVATRTAELARSVTNASAPSLKKELFLNQLRLELLKPGEIEAHMADLPLSAKETEAARHLLTISCFNEIAASVTDRSDIDQVRRAGKGFLEMKKKGLTPSGGEEKFFFWTFMIAHAEKENDADTFEECLRELAPMISGTEQGQKQLKRGERLLKRMRNPRESGAPDEAQ